MVELVDGYELCFGFITPLSISYSFTSSLREIHYYCYCYYCYDKTSLQMMNYCPIVVIGIGLLVMMIIAEYCPLMADSKL